MEEKTIIWNTKIVERKSTSRMNIRLQTNLLLETKTRDTLQMIPQKKIKVIM